MGTDPPGGFIGNGGSIVNIPVSVDKVNLRRPDMRTHSAVTDGAALVYNLFFIRIRRIRKSFNGVRTAQENVKILVSAVQVMFHIRVGSSKVIFPVCMFIDIRVCTVADQRILENGFLKPAGDLVGARSLCIYCRSIPLYRKHSAAAVGIFYSCFGRKVHRSVDRGGERNLFYSGQQHRLRFSVYRKQCFQQRYGNLQPVFGIRYS